MSQSDFTPTNKFELLRVKSILGILDGDADFGMLEINGRSSDIKISMPYLSGPILCDISNRFGLYVEYGWGGGPTQSRWQYLDDLLSHCIQNERMSELLSFLFSKGQFVEKLKGKTPEIIEYAHSQIVNSIIEQINGVLYFGGNELVKIGGVFIIREIGTNIAIMASSVKMIDREYIVNLSDRAMQDVLNGNYDSALTKSRTLLEEVFCYVIEKKDEKPLKGGDIKKLHNQVKQLYNMHQNKDIDKRINDLLSGLEKILSSITEMRNIGSDSHGVGIKRISITTHHARLFVNAAMTMADFILAVSEKSK